ncbi:MAG: UPF0280 family protein [Archaeoglobaceae archaeon]|nr:UPF0280 family protein [Archaeoglobaceae archaeon]MDW7989205.1 UPF0280 family protein [Archaeoglobaceae archaeon]
MKRFKFAYKETITTILTENEEFYKVAIRAILEARSEIERYAIRFPEFLISYEPLECRVKGIVNKMCKAAKIANVGPMASVAGAIADYAVEKMVEAGAKLAVVDNGGDIAIQTDRELRVGIFPTKFAFVIPPGERIAICTSSGKIGPSVSFGFADCATIVADDACIADAIATALGNLIRDDVDFEEIIKSFYNRYVRYIRGLLVVKDEMIALAGHLPKIEEAIVKEDLITRI